MHTHHTRHALAKIALPATHHSFISACPVFVALSPITADAACCPRTPLRSRTGPAPSPVGSRSCDPPPLVCTLEHWHMIPIGQHPRMSTPRIYLRSTSCQHGHPTVPPGAPAPLTLTYLPHVAHSTRKVGPWLCTHPELTPSPHAGKKPHAVAWVQQGQRHTLPEHHAFTLLNRNYQQEQRSTSTGLVLIRNRVGRPAT